jgi:Tfp pilus assembly protein PilF
MRLSLSARTQIKVITSAYLGLGTAAFRAGQSATLPQLLRKLLALDPNNIEASTVSAIQVTKPERPRTRCALKQVIKFKRDHAQAHYSLGLVYASLGDKDGVTIASSYDSPNSSIEAGRTAIQHGQEVAKKIDA